MLLQKCFAEALIQHAGEAASCGSSAADLSPAGVRAAARTRIQTLMVKYPKKTLMVKYAEKLNFRLYIMRMFNFFGIFYHENVDGKVAQKVKLSLMRQAKV